MHALEMHLLFVDLGKVGTELRVDLESSCSSLGRIVRIPCCAVLCCVVLWREGRGVGELQTSGGQ